MARRLPFVSLLLVAIAALAQLSAVADYDFPQQVTMLVNDARAREGLPPLTLEPRLVQAAQGHSEDMAAHTNLSHTGSDGSSPWERIKRAGYDWAAASECVAGGQPSPERVVTEWLNSPPHRRVLMGGYQQIGVGYAYTNASFQHFWTADVASEVPTPTPIPRPPTPSATSTVSPAPSPTATVRSQPSPVATASPEPSPTHSSTVAGRYVIRLTILKRAAPVRPPEPTPDRPYP